MRLLLGHLIEDGALAGPGVDLSGQDVIDAVLVGAGKIDLLEPGVVIADALFPEVVQGEKVAGGRRLIDKGKAFAPHLQPGFDAAVLSAQDHPVVGGDAVRFFGPGQWFNMQLPVEQGKGEAPQEGAIQLLRGEIFDHIAIAGEDLELDGEAKLSGEVIGKRGVALFLLEDVQLRDQAKTEPGRAGGWLAGGSRVVVGLIPAGREGDGEAEDEDGDEVTPERQEIHTRATNRRIGSGSREGRVTSMACDPRGERRDTRQMRPPVSLVGHRRRATTRPRAHPGLTSTSMPRGRRPRGGLA